MKSTRLIIIFLGLIYTPISYSKPAGYETDPSHLSEQKRKLFLEVQSTLDDWDGEYEKLASASIMINSFIHTNPNFLPIYIEKSRLLIMTGTTGQNDFAKLNRDAIEILKEVTSKAPHYPKPYVLAGHAYTNIKDYENAKKSLERAQNLKSEDPWLYNNWAQFHAQNKQYERTIDNAKKALVLSQDNPKSLISAIYYIDKYSKFTNKPSLTPNIQELVFESFKEPQKRLRIAKRLIGAYNGNPKILDDALKIIVAQKRESPNLEAVDLSMAEWLLAKGYRVTNNMIDQYDPEMGAAAEKLLQPIQKKPELATRIFSALFAIALSDKNITKANNLLQDAQTNGIPHHEIMSKKALLMWLAGDYTAVVNVYEVLSRQSPDYEDSALLMEAYARLGRVDKLEAHHKRKVQIDPTSAWRLGNYAHFMLFNKRDIDGAIEYGEKALEQMRYPIAENITSLAYLMKASIQKDNGNHSEARKNLERAHSIGYDDAYIEKYCAEYCNAIRRLQ